MGFEKKKREEEGTKSKTFFTSLNRTFFASLKKKRRLIEFSLALMLLLLGFVTYLTITNKQRADFPQGASSSDRYTQMGINHYRLENYERAEMLFLKAMETSKSRTTKTLAAVYLGNIFFKKKDYDAALDYYNTSLSFDKNNVFALYNSALSHLRMGESERAMENALKVFELEKSFVPGLLLLGNIFYATKKYTKALSMYMRADTRDALLQYNKACTYLRLNRFDDAVEALETIVEDEQSHKTVQGIGFFTLGYLLHPFDKARSIESFRNSLKVFPSSSGLRYNLALLLLETERYGEAVSMLESVENGRRYKGFDWIFGQALFKSGAYDKAFNIYMTLYRKTQDPAIAYIIGDICVKLGDNKMAKTYYQKALMDPANEGVIANLSKIYQNDGLYDQAERLGHEYLERRRTSPIPYRFLADLYFTQGREGDAIQYLEKAILYSGEDVSELIKVAHTFQKHELFNNALQTYYRILSINTEYYWAHVKIAEVFLKTGHNDKVKKVITNIRDKITDLDLYYTASLLLALAEEGVDAEPIYKELVQDFPYRYEAYHNLSLLYLEEQEYEELIETLQLCFKNNPFLNGALLSHLHTLLGAAYYYEGDHGKASLEFRKALELDKNNEIPALNLSLLGHVNRRGNQ